MTAVFFRACAAIGILSYAWALPCALAGDGDCPGVGSYLHVNGGALRQTLTGAASRRLRILAIGSSSTEGVGTTARRFAYPQQLQDILARTWGIPADVVNAGIGGEKVAATLARLKAALKRDRPDLVIWQVGTNDALAGDDEARFRALLGDGIDSVEDAKVGLVLLDPQYVPDMKAIDRIGRYADDIAALARVDKVPVFSRFAMMRAWAGGVLGAMLAKDRLHMSDRGYGCLALRLAGELARQRGVPVVSAALLPLTRSAYGLHSGVGE